MKVAAFLIALSLPASALAQAPATNRPHGHSHHEEGKAGKAAAVKPKSTVPATAVSPEYVQLAKNVEVIPNIEDAVKSSASVLTHEGLFGPLLFAENNRAFFIELKPGMFLGEHPHDTGSIVYTVRGKWVLASEGKRQVMEEGSLFRFGDGMPTGWEAPFAEGALLLIVKDKQGREDYATFNAGIKSMQATVDKERREGTSFYFNELQPDHPAIAFARSVNPKFDDVLANIKY
jgi:quercetin dioxygenase-like cupin family protein